MKFVVLILITSFLWANPQEKEEKEKKEKKQMEPILIVIDIQNKYLEYIPEREKNLGLEMINAAIWLFRKHEFPVIRVYHTDPKWGPEPGTEPFEFPESVNIKPEDPKVVKNYGNAFTKTELDSILREKNANTLFLCGLSAVGCVLATYQGAHDLDYNVVMIKDAIMSHESRYTDSIEEIFDTVSFTTMNFMLGYAEN